MSQATILDTNTANNMRAQTTASSLCEDSYLIVHGDGPSSEQGRDATGASPDRPWKTSFKNKLTSMTGTFMAHIFPQENFKGFADLYEHTARDLDARSRNIRGNFYNRATVPDGGAPSTTAAAMPPSATKRSTSWTAKVARVTKCALCVAVTGTDVLLATVAAGLDAAHAAIETAGEAAIAALDSWCEDE